MATKAAATKAGVWIDHKQAIVVLIHGANKGITKIASGIKKTARPGDGPKAKSRYTPHDIGADERRFGNELNKFYDEVIACIRSAEAILILGPAEAKREFAKRINSKKLGAAVALEAADKMTDGQIMAKVSLHFTPKAAGKSPTPKKKKTVKKAAVKRAAKTTPRQRTKKQGK